MKNWLIVGATSGIAVPLARRLAMKGFRLCLAGRDSEQLGILADDLRARSGTAPETRLFEALDFESHAGFLDEIEANFGELDGIIWAVGILDEPRKLLEDFQAAKLVLDTNFTAAMSLLSLVALKMEQRRRGQIVAIGSVGGDRGRRSNAVYGASKAALHTFLQGLRQRLAPAGVNVLTVKPGPVRTKMTAGRDKLPLLAEPDVVARDIERAIMRKAEVVYSPWPWSFIVPILRHVPEKIFKRMKM